MSAPIRLSGILVVACALQAADLAFRVETVAGGSFAGDGGPALAAAFSQPEGIVRDAAGNLYVADAGDHRIRKISPDGLITTVAGDGQPGFAGDGGPAAQARLDHPYGLALDRSGALYVADLGSARVRRISPDGIITTFAGGGSVDPAAGDGSSAKLLRLTSPRNLAFDPAGSLYISDFGGHRVYRVDPSGNMTTVAGTGVAGSARDGSLARDAQLSYPAGLAADYSGTLYIADSGNRRILRLAGRTLWTWGGNLESAPTGLTVDAGGNLFIGNPEGGTVMRISVMGGLTSLPVAGNGLFAADGQLYLSAQSQVSVFDLATRQSAPVAGLGDIHFFGDGGPATLGRLDGPYALAAGNAGDFFIADFNNRRVRRVDSTGWIETVAGDGSASLLDEVAGLAVDAEGSLWISVRAAHSLWRFTNGQLRLVAGTGSAGLKGDGGPAASASLNAPHGLAFDHNGALYIADTGNGRVRRITPDGWISTVVSGLNEPRGVAFDAAGNLYIAETAAGRVQRLAEGGTLEVIASGLKGPRGITVADDGSIYVAESGASRIVELTSGSVLDGFKAPMDIMALPGGALLVADFGNNRVQRLTSQAPPVTMPPEAHVMHAATNHEGPVAPGEIVSIYGEGFVPPCTVTVDATPAWLLYIGPSQINAVLPGDLAADAALQIRCADALKGAASLDVVPSNPGLFASAGHLAALNQDGSANSGANPAARGSIVSLFGTGLGTAQSVFATIGGTDAEVLYAGPAPGLPGVFQVNARIPETTDAGEVEVRATASGLTSPSGPTISVR